VTDYRTLAQALMALDAERAAAISAASRTYAVAVAGATQEVSIAEASVWAAERATHAAAERVADVDERASGIWRELGALLGRRGRRLGPIPPPAAECVDSAGSGYSDPLDGAREMITRTALGEPIAPVPRWIVGFLPVLGAVAAIVVTAPIRGVLALTGERVFAVNLVAQILMFFAPFAGVPLLVSWTGRHYGARPDIGAIGLTALGGMIASCGIVLLFR
jgi:hypothetical protein